VCSCADGKGYTVDASSLAGCGLQFFKPAVDGDLKLTSFIHKLQAAWKDPLLQAHDDKKPVDAQVGDGTVGGSTGWFVLLPH
jgi:hypothetical protein